MASKGKENQNSIGFQIAQLIHVVVVFLSSATLIFQGSQCLFRWLKSDTKAILKVQPSAEVLFPAVTLCPNYNDAFNKTFLKELKIERHEYKNADYFGNNPYNMTGTEIFERVTFGLSETLVKLMIRHANSSTYKAHVNFIEGVEEYEHVKISVVYHINLGRCYSFRVSEEISAFGVVTFEAISNVGLYAYLHHPGQYSAIDSKTKFGNKIGQMIFIDMDHEMTTDTLERAGACNSSLDFEYDHCVYEEVSNMLFEEFGCISAMLPPHPERPVCKFNKTDEGQALQNEFLQRYVRLMFHGQTEVRDACITPCSSQDIKFGLPDIGTFFDAPNLAYLKIYARSSIKTKEIVYDYSWVSMLAEIGGYTGLLLGISAVSVTSMLNQLFWRLAEKMPIKTFF